VAAAFALPVCRCLRRSFGAARDEPLRHSVRRRQRGKEEGPEGNLDGIDPALPCRPPSGEPIATSVTLSRFRYVIACPREGEDANYLATAAEETAQGHVSSTINVRDASMIDLCFGASLAVPGRRGARLNLRGRKSIVGLCSADDPLIIRFSLSGSSRRGQSGPIVDLSSSALSWLQTRRYRSSVGGGALCPSRNDCGSITALVHQSGPTPVRCQRDHRMHVCAPSQAATAKCP
jgi:hypothetical protein